MAGCFGCFWLQHAITRVLNYGRRLILKNVDVASVSGYSKSLCYVDLASFQSLGFQCVTIGISALPKTGSATHTREKSMPHTSSSMPMHTSICSASALDSQVNIRTRKLCLAQVRTKNSGIMWGTDPHSTQTEAKLACTIRAPASYVITYMEGCQNYRPFLGTLYIRGRIIIGTQKGTIILTTTHMYI